VYALLLYFGIAKCSTPKDAAGYGNEAPALTDLLSVSPRRMLLK